MAILHQLLCLPKRGNTQAEYEDRAACNAAAGRFAISDGATESSFADLWAELLVNGFVESKLQPAEDPSAGLSQLQQHWLDQVSGKSLPWYAERKFHQGAFATFLGLVVEPCAGAGRNRWRACAVGDSCLFHVRSGRLHCSFPLSDPAAFGNTPMLIGSRMPVDRLLDSERTHFSHGDWLSDDRFWLMTDALAQWFLQQHHADLRPWETLERFALNSSRDSFESWIDDLRDRREIRNDDVTLLVVKV